MTRRTNCETFGCPRLAAGHRYCSQCRTMRKRAKDAGKDPDAMSWRQLEAGFWNVREKACAAS